MDKLICIYKITNTVTGDFYIGQTQDFHTRQLQHKRDPQLKMREDVEKYGWDAFKFEIVELFTVENLAERETYYIRTLKPPYNTVFKGYERSPETCEKIRQAKLGQTHTTESCEKMSEKRLGVTLSDEHKEKCRQKSLGNKSHSKAVVCVETGKVYDNMKIAAADIGIDPSAISGVIRGINITAGGYHWRYADEDANTGSRKRNVAVICLDTGETFPTLDAAAKRFGINPSTVGKIVRGKCKSSLHFQRVEEPSHNEIRGEDKRKNNLPDSVICVETGECFESIRQAAKALGIVNTSISSVLRGKLITAGGFHWQYADGRPIKLREKKTPKTAAKSIICIETEKIFPSVTTAAEEMRVVTSSISNALKDRSKTSGGYHWRYAD